MGEAEIAQVARMFGAEGALIARALRSRCAECGRVFDLLSDEDAQEWAYGHDCEVGE